jgi:hypothetical protein
LSLFWLLVSAGVTLMQPVMGACFLLFGSVAIIATLRQSTRRVTIEAAQGVLRCENGWIGFCKRIELSTSAIASIDSKTIRRFFIRSMGECLVVQSTDGKEHVLLDGLPSRYVGRRIAKQLRQTIADKHQPRCETNGSLDGEAKSV